MGVIVRMNNVKHAYPGELGFAWPGTLPDEALGGCDVLADNEGGHTSASLMLTDDAGEVVHHVLVDAGLGTLSSLREAVRQSGRWRGRIHIDAILVTHNHTDHLAELPLIGGMFRRLRTCGLVGDRQPFPIPVWCMAEVGERFGAKFPSPPAPPPARLRDERLRFLLFGLDRWVQTAPVYRTIYPLGPDGGLRVTPVGGVAHANGVIFVVEVEDRKIILAWDMGKLPWDRDTRTAGSISEDLRAILGDPDLVIIEANTFEKRDTGHICAHDAGRFLRAVGKPDTRCYLVHYSGFEDFFGSPPGTAPTPIYDNAQLESEVEKLDGRMGVARAGDEVVV
jgi:phosphoribosyl 1,2-cyclic phosphodiesterase